MSSSNHYLNIYGKTGWNSETTSIRCDNNWKNHSKNNFVLHRLHLRLRALSSYLYPSWHLLLQSPQKKHHNICAKCLKLTIKTPKWRYWHCSGVVLASLLLTLTRFHVFLGFFSCLFWTSKCRLGSSN